MSYYTLQAFDNEQEERTADAIEAYVDSSAGESDDEKDKDDETAAAEKKDQLDQAQASLQHLEGGAAQLESAMEFKEKVLSTIKDKDNKNNQKRKLEKLEAGDIGGVGGDNGQKSARSSTLLDTNGNPIKKMKKHVSISEDVMADKASPSKGSTSSSKGSGSSSALNEDNVRAYIKRQGGRVQSKVLMKVGFFGGEVESVADSMNDNNGDCFVFFCLCLFLFVNESIVQSVATNPIYCFPFQSICCNILTQPLSALCSICTISLTFRMYIKKIGIQKSYERYRSLSPRYIQDHCGQAY